MLLCCTAIETGNNALIMITNKYIIQLFYIKCKLLFAHSGQLVFYVSKTCFSRVER